MKSKPRKLETGVSAGARILDLIQELTGKVHTPAQVDHIDRLVRKANEQTVDWIEKNLEIVEV